MNYEFVPVNTDDKSIREIAALLRTTFPKAEKYSDQFIAWQYRDNPDGKVIGYNAYYDGMLTAHYAIMPIDALLFGKEEKGVLSLNTATHPDHQGQKLFTTLAQMSYKAAAEQGYGFVIGVANGNSTHGFVTKLGFQLAGQLDAKLGMGKLVHTEKKSPVDFRKIWNTASIKWRLSNPELKYKVKNNRIYSATDKAGIEAILFDAGSTNVVEDNMIGIGFRPVKLWIGINNSIDWKRSFYFNVPAKMRPSPLNFIFKDLTPLNRKLNFDNVKFNALDFDAY